MQMELLEEGPIMVTQVPHRTNHHMNNLLHIHHTRRKRLAAPVGLGFGLEWALEVFWALDWVRIDVGASGQHRTAARHQIRRPDRPRRLPGPLLARRERARDMEEPKGDDFTFQKFIIYHQLVIAKNSDKNGRIQCSIYGSHAERKGGKAVSRHLTFQEIFFRSSS